MTDFLDFARSHGLLIDPSKFFASDRIRRCGTVDKPRSDNGAWYWDGERGWVMDWAGEARPVWFASGKGKAWTDEDKRSWAHRRALAAKAQEERHEAAARTAMNVLKHAEMKTHPYLELKGFPEEKGLVIEDALLVPMRNVQTNLIQGYQSIRWNAETRKYEKKMLAGMRARAAVFPLGNSPDVWLVEGYATGLSVRAALRASGLTPRVVVCFSAVNLVEVAGRIGGRRWVFADNDESRTGEEAARETGLPYTMADTVGWDANDLHLKEGLFAVTKKIMECMWARN